MDERSVKKNLLNELRFSENDIEKLEILAKKVIDYNNKYNLISKSTEKTIWSRHILDSAQLVKFINFRNNGSLADLGSGAGFPGLILAIYNKNRHFKIKLYEKSNVKANFLEGIIEILKLNAVVNRGDLNNNKIKSFYIVCRAFKKLPEILRISREIAEKPYKLIILKGKSAQVEINNVFKKHSFKYKIEKSITDKDSKILVIYSK